MKKLKSTAAVLLASAFFAPLALSACTQNHDFDTENSVFQESVHSSPDQIQSEAASPDLENSVLESDSENEENSSAEMDSSVDVPPAVSPPDQENPPSAPSQTPETKADAKYIRCTANQVNIRMGAGTDYTIVGSANEGTMYAVIGKSGNWYQTYYRNKVAYIYAEYASVFTLEKTTDEGVENVIAEGYKLIGVPYVYGAVRLHDGKGKLLSGFSAQKFDCSSLIQYIFYKGAGKLLNVNTRTQVKQGKYVAKKDLQRGDCLFFTNEDRQYNTGIERVGHVALYLGNNYILHTASDYARIEQVSQKRWSFFIEGRRFL